MNVVTKIRGKGQLRPSLGYGVAEEGGGTYLYWARACGETSTAPRSGKASLSNTIRPRLAEWSGRGRQCATPARFSR